MYSGYGMTTDGNGTWSFGYGYARNVVNFSVDNSSLYHTDNCNNFFIAR